MIPYYWYRAGGCVIGFAAMALIGLLHTFDAWSFVAGMLGFWAAGYAVAVWHMTWIPGALLTPFYWYRGSACCFGFGVMQLIEKRHPLDWWSFIAGMLCFWAASCGLVAWQQRRIWRELRFADVRRAGR